MEERIPERARIKKAEKNVSARRLDFFRRRPPHLMFARARSVSHDDGREDAGKDKRSRKTTKILPFPEVNSLKINCWPLDEDETINFHVE